MVEDNEINQRSSFNVFTKAQIEVDVANNGLEAGWNIQKIKENMI